MSESVKIIESDNVQSIATRAFSGTPFFIVETMETPHARTVLGRPTYVIVDRLTPDFPLDAYASGRIFDETGELKWQKNGETCQMVYIGNGLKDDEEAKTKRELDNPKDDKIVLLGRKVSTKRLKEEMGFETDDEIFIEGAIPQYLHYPEPVRAGDYERMQIHVRQYYDKTGHLEYYRFVGMSNTK